MKKRKIYKIHPCRKYIFFVLLFFFFVGVGYSLLNTGLNIFGSLTLKGHCYPNGSLYSVLECEAKNSGYAKEYTGEHHDSFTEEPSKAIYHWYATNDSEGSEVLDKNNVLFAGKCWQMIRTTDTGGVKMIYNGMPNDGKCNNTGTDQQIGTSKFNTSTNSAAYVGYMYNKVYAYQLKNATSYSVLKSASINSSIWFYDDGGMPGYSPEGWIFSDSFQVSNSDDYASLVGKYTFHNTNQNYSSDKVRYIVEVNGSTYYYVVLTSGEDIAQYSIMYGDSYNDNDDGTFSINNSSEIKFSDWYTNYSNVGIGKYVCIITPDDNCSELWYTAATSTTNISYIKVSNEYKYAQGFTYDENTNMYTLNDDSVSFWNVSDNTNQNSLNAHHYTCWNETGECGTLSYVYFTENFKQYYINLTDGKSVEDAKNEMLYNDDVNQTDSTIKVYIDNWYQENMTHFTSYLEDTVFCNNRSQSNLSTNGWNPDGGSVKTYMFFNYDTLKCSNEVDQFSLSNDKAKLTYPVGLASDKEMMLLDGGSDSLWKTGQSYWLNSPRYFVVHACESVANAAGSTTVGLAVGVRPAISLKPGTKYISGTGSIDNPYIVNTN